MTFGDWNCRQKISIPLAWQRKYSYNFLIWKRVQSCNLRSHWRAQNYSILWCKMMFNQEQMLWRSPHTTDIHDPCYKVHCSLWAANSDMHSRCVLLLATTPNMLLSSSSLNESQEEGSCCIFSKPLDYFPIFTVMLVSWKARARNITSMSSLRWIYQ